MSIYITGDCHGDYRRFSTEIFPEQYTMGKSDYVDILVREYRCSGGTDTASPAAGNRCSGTGIPHLIDCYLRVYSLKAGFNPYTSRIER